MTYQALYQEGCSVLAQAGVEEAALDARLLLEYVCGTNRNDLLVRGQQQVTPEREGAYRSFLEKRALRIPLQQIRVHRNLWDLSLK